VKGSTKLLRARAIPGTEWYAVIAVDKSEATAGMRSLLTASMIALIAIAGIAAAVVAAATTVSFQRLSKVRDAMDGVASGEGDLTKRLPAVGNDEIAQIARSFNTFIDKISHVMRQIRDTSESVRVAANEIAAGNVDLSGRTECAAASLQQTAASMEEITSTVTQSASAAKQADYSAVSASQVASRGGEVIAHLITTMGEIEHASVRYPTSSA
jgi:methyl-accepting chemotaxis protein